MSGPCVVRVDIDRSSLERVNKILSGVQYGALKATDSALRRAGASAKTQAGRFAAAEYTIHKDDFMRNVYVKLHSKGGKSGMTELYITFMGNVLPLKTFATKVSSDGRVVTTQVKRKGTPETLRHAFEAKMGTHTGIYERIDTSRFPVEQKYGPSAGHMMRNEEVVKKMEETIVSTFEKRIDHEVLRVLNGWGR